MQNPYIPRNARSRSELQKKAFIFLKVLLALFKIKLQFLIKFQHFHILFIFCTVYNQNPKTTFHGNQMKSSIQV